LDQDTLSGPESQVSTAEVEPLTRPALASLPDGGFIVVWADKRQNERIRAQRYGIDGQKNGPEFRANTVPGRILSSWPTLVPLSGGRFLLAWTQVNVDNPAAGTNIAARIFSPGAGPIGQPVQADTLTRGQRFSLSAAVTAGPGGEIAFLTWTDDSSAGPDKSGRAIEGRALPIHATGFSSGIAW